MGADERKEAGMGGRGIDATEKKTGKSDIAQDNGAGCLVWKRPQVRREVKEKKITDCAEIAERKTEE